MLADGRVLIVGWTPQVAEVYDPAAGCFVSAGRTGAHHGQFLTATLLPNGKVLVAGGLVLGGASATKGAELFVITP